MAWVYAAILAFSAGLATYVFSRTTDRLTAFLGLAPLKHNVLSYAAIIALAFLMVAQAPAMVLCAAFLLWFAGARHVNHPFGFPVEMGLLILATLLGIAALSAPQFGLPPQIPKAVVMGGVYLVWLLTCALPLGAPGQGLFAAFAASLSIFIVGAIVLELPISIATDAILLGAALGGAYLALNLANSHAGPGGQWVFLYLFGFLMACSIYAGAWWLGLLGIAPIAVYTLVRK